MSQYLKTGTFQYKTLITYSTINV